MAIKAVSLTGTVAASSRGNFLSPQILTRHRPIAAMLWTSTSAIGSRYSIFLTRSEVAVDVPQAGDPSEFQILDVPTPGTNLVIIPFAVQTIVEPPVRFNFSFYNAATSEATVVATYVYEEVT
jgi:hypothetical protein